MGCGQSSDASSPDDKTRKLHRKPNWKLINSKLVVDKTPEGKAKRKEQFDGFDVNHNGYLSLAEVDKGLRDILQLDDLFDCKPVIMRAFQSAKGLNAPNANEHGKDYIERNEYRMLLVYLKEFMAIWEVFATADDSDDRRLSKQELSKVHPQLQKWAPGQSIDQIWAAANTDGGNLILWTEFAEWAIPQQLAQISGDLSSD
jgi:Ca2+-binding EF-hand superfamily protein